MYMLIKKKKLKQGGGGVSSWCLYALWFNSLNGALVDTGLLKGEKRWDADGGCAEERMV